MKQRIAFYLSVASLALFAACNSPESGAATEEVSKGITRADWGTADGKPVYLYTLTNSKGDQVKISNYGGVVTSWTSKDKNDSVSSVVLGFDSLQGYMAPPPYFGALVGRYGNRIAKGKFSIDGNEYTLVTNNGPNALHGGTKGFDKVVWESSTDSDSTAVLHLKYISADGEEGYPGQLTVMVTYSFSDDDELKIQYEAETTKPTVLNLTNHSYFNLTGSVANTILQHELEIDADHYTPVDTTLIPTGEIAPVEGTPFDFRQPHVIGERIDQVPGGYDHNFVLNKKDSSLTKIVTLYDPMSGRQLEVSTTQPGVQFYTGNFLDGSLTAPSGLPIKQHTGMCLETQHFPDSPNQKNFPSTVLRPGEKYQSETIYKLSVR